MVGGAKFPDRRLTMLEQDFRRRFQTFSFDRRHVDLTPAEFVELFREEPVYLTLREALGTTSTNEQRGNTQSTIGVAERSKAEKGKAQAATGSRTAQLAAGAIMFAVGVIHLVWLASGLAGEDVIALMQEAWPFGDLIFGLGGIMIGIAIMLPVDWARLGGICFCLLRVLAGVLWFVSDEPVDRLPLAWNIMTAPLTVAGVWYFLFWWPSERSTG